MDTNQLFGINKLPAQFGLMIFPISMSRIANSQSPEKCLEYIRLFNPSKISAPLIGLNFLYSHSLYLGNDLANNKGSYDQLRSKYLTEAEKHRGGMQKIVKRLTTTEFQIPWAIDYMAWDQAIMNAGSFVQYLSKLHKIFKADTDFQRCIHQDCTDSGKEYSTSQVNFFLEEHLLVYFIAKGNVSFHNNHVQGRQKWVLWCYPGKPPRGLVYLFQLNPFKLSWKENKYEHVCQYNLLDGLLYDATKIDLNNYSVI